MDTNLSWGTPAILSGPAKRARIHPMCRVCHNRLRHKREIARKIHQDPLICEANLLHASSTTVLQRYVSARYFIVKQLTLCLLSSSSSPPLPPDDIPMIPTTAATLNSLAPICATPSFSKRLSKTRGSQAVEAGRLLTEELQAALFKAHEVETARIAALL